MNRRDSLKFLGCIPFLGFLKNKSKEPEIPEWPLGTRLITPDGRVYRYVEWKKFEKDLV